MARALTKTDFARIVVYVRSGLVTMPGAADPRVRRLMRRRRKALQELHDIAQRIVESRQRIAACPDPDEVD